MNMIKGLLVSCGLLFLCGLACHDETPTQKAKLNKTPVAINTVTGNKIISLSGGIDEAEIVHLNAYITRLDAYNVRALILSADQIKLLKSNKGYKKALIETAKRENAETRTLLLLKDNGEVLDTLYIYGQN